MKVSITHAATVSHCVHRNKITSTTTIHKVQ